MKTIINLLLSLLICNYAYAQNKSFVADEIIIQFNKKTAQTLKQEKQLGQVNQANNNISRINRKYGISEIKAVFQIQNENGNSKYGFSRIFVLKLPPNSDLQQIVGEYNSLSEVVYAEPNYLYSINFEPDDEFLSNQWAVQNNGDIIADDGSSVGTIGADLNLLQAWDISTGSERDTIAIIDSGIDYNHPEFTGRIAAGYDFVNGDSDPMDDNGHGTACAGIAAATGNNNIGIAGVNWRSKIMPVKVMDKSGSGYSGAIANGVKFAADNGAKILSLSFGGSESSTTLKSALDYAYEKGCIIICAMGNANTSDIRYPAAYENTVAVGAISPCNNRKDPTTCDKESWWGSNYGEHIDFMAPGVRIYTTDILGDNGYNDAVDGDYFSVFNGTSAATPFAAGVASLIKANRPDLTNDEVRAMMRNSAVDIDEPGFDVETGYGRLDAYNALVVSSGGFRIMPDAINFGDTGLGDSLSRSITIFNQTEAGCVINFSLDSPYFSTVNSSIEAPANSTIDETVWFKPDLETDYLATLTCSIGDTIIYISLTGLGVPQPDITVYPHSLDFNMSSGDSSQATLIIENQGDLNLNWKTYLSYERSTKATGFSVTDAELPKILMLEAVNWGNIQADYHSEALNNLGYSYTQTNSWPQFDSLLTGERWNLVIVSCYSTNLYRNELLHLDEYQDNGGRLLFAFWKANFTPTAGADDLYQHMGVKVGSVYSHPLNLVANDTSHIIFKYPNRILDIPFTHNTSDWYINGQWIDALENSTTLMSVKNNSFIPTSVLNKNRNTIYNCFQGPDYRGDHDTDGKTDIVELYENQIEYLLNYGGEWLSTSADSGLTEPAANSELNIKVNTLALLPGTYSMNVAFSSNDPNEALANVPVTLFIDAQQISFSVDMSMYESNNYFDAVKGDKLFVRGNFNFWKIKEEYRLLSVGNGVYEVTFPVYYSSADTLQYKYFIQGGDGREMPNNGWEDAPGTFGEDQMNRGFVLTGNDETLPTVYYNNNQSGFPKISVNPDSLELTLNEGDSITVPLLITNNGGAGLNWNISAEFYTKRSFTLSSPIIQSGSKRDRSDVNQSGQGKIITGDFADLSGVKILIDQKHGQLEYSENWAIIISDLELRGAQIYRNNQKFTDVDLGSYDIIWTMDANVYFNDQELVAISDWVQSGGSLLFEGDAYSTVIVNNHLLNALHAGIEYTQEDGSSGNTTDIFFHPVTTNIDTIAIGRNDAQLKNIHKPAVVLVNDVYGLPAVALSRYGHGRIFVMADELFNNTRMAQADNQQFANQVFDWLAFDGEYGISFDRQSGSVQPSTNETIAVKINTVSIPGGNYTPKIVIENDDPSRPVLKLPLNLQVIGDPIISVDSNLDFAEKGVGYTASDNISIYNAGSDVLHVTGLSIDDDHFTADFTPFSLAPTTSRNIALQFTPEDTTTYTANLSIQNNDTLSFVSLSGKGLFVPNMTLSTDSISITLNEGASTNIVVQINNNGQADLKWNAAIGIEGILEETVDESFSGEKNILAFTKYVPLWPDHDYEHTINAIKHYYPDFSVTNTNTTESAKLETELEDKDIFLIPAQYFNTSEPLRHLMYDLGVAWKSVLHNFVEQGGMLIVGDFYESTIGVLNGSEIMSVGHHYNYPLHTEAKVENLHTITTNVSPEFEAMNGVEEFISTDGRTVISNKLSGMPMVAYKEIGLGGVIVISWDYHFYNDDVNRVIANAVQWQPGKNWVSATIDSGIVTANETGDISLKINSKNLGGGHYNGSINFSTNDWDNPSKSIPILINVESVNDAPLLFDLPDTLSLSQTSPAALKVWKYSYDAEQSDSTLDFRFDLSPDTLNLLYAPDSGWLHLEIDNKFTGIIDLMVTVSDDSGAYAIASTQLSVKEPTGLSEELFGHVPKDYELKQNYPNPFNPVTSILYGLPERAHVTLEVFSISGQRIATLFDGEQPAGYQKVDWNAVNFSSGMYFYRIMAKGKRNFNRVRKLLLLK